MVVLPVDAQPKTPKTSSYGPRHLPQAVGSVTEALSGVSDRVRILLPPQFGSHARVGKGVKYTRLDSALKSGPAARHSADAADRGRPTTKQQHLFIGFLMPCHQRHDFYFRSYYALSTLEARVEAFAMRSCSCSKMLFDGLPPSGRRSGAES